jgi:hypothetical protein
LLAKLSASTLDVNTPAKCQGRKRSTPHPLFKMSPGIGMSVLANCHAKSAARHRAAKAMVLVADGRCYHVCRVDVGFIARDWRMAAETHDFPRRSLTFGPI